MVKELCAWTSPASEGNSHVPAYNITPAQTVAGLQSHHKGLWSKAALHMIKKEVRVWLWKETGRDTLLQHPRWLPVLHSNRLLSSVGWCKSWELLITVLENHSIEKRRQHQKNGILLKGVERGECYIRPLTVIAHSRKGSNSCPFKDAIVPSSQPLQNKGAHKSFLAVRWEPPSQCPYYFKEMCIACFCN